MRPFDPFDPRTSAKTNMSVPPQGTAVDITKPKPSQTTIQLEQLKSNVHELERIAEVLQQRLSPILTDGFEPKPDPTLKPVATPLVGELSSISDRTLAVISQFHQIINNIDI